MCMNKRQIFILIKQEDLYLAPKLLNNNSQCGKNKS